jgi:ABC-type phosphate transport system substrate-binding protein
MIIILAAALLMAIPANGQVSVIANKGVPDVSLSPDRVAGIFSLQVTKWSDGSKVFVVDNGGDVREEFYKAIGKDPGSVKKDWLKKVLTGEVKAPETANSDDDVVKRVSATSGAVGFVKSSSVKGDVKVLAEIK